MSIRIRLLNMATRFELGTTKALVFMLVYLPGSKVATYRKRMASILKELGRNLQRLRAVRNSRVRPRQVRLRESGGGEGLRIAD